MSDFRKKLFLIFSLVFLILSGCKDEPVSTEENSNGQNGIPVLISPSNQGTIQTLSVIFDWEDFNGAVSYLLQVSTDANFATNVFIDTIITSSGFNTAGFTTNIYYYWRVYANLQTGSTPASSVWRFNIILTPPGEPQLSSPLNNSTGVFFYPQFEWNNVQTATSYRIQVSRNNSFSQIVIDSGRISPNLFQTPIFTLTTNTLYYWRVNASNSNGVSTGPWSAIWNFTTVQGPNPNSISGTVTFVDTSYIQQDGYYQINAYINWPPNGNPFKEDSLHLVQIGNIYQADYQLDMLYNNNYYLSVSFFSTDFLLRTYTLGVYGCDTNRIQYSTCANNPSTVQIQNNWGVENISFLSWADTSKKIFPIKP